MKWNVWSAITTSLVQQCSI